MGGALVMARVFKRMEALRSDGFSGRREQLRSASVPLAERSSAGPAGFCVGGGDSFLSIIPSKTAKSFRARLRLAEQRNGSRALVSGGALAHRSTNGTGALASGWAFAHRGTNRDEALVSGRALARRSTDDDTSLVSGRALARRTNLAFQRLDSRAICTLAN